MRRLWPGVAAIAFVITCFGHATTARQAASPDRPAVVLISIDGWRWDYAERFAPPALTALAAGGVRAEGLIPPFPSKTFPSHYTIVTGLRPSRHGIVSNTMVAPDVPGRFAISNREALADPRWWHGEPIWNTAQRQGLIAASMFWPGSETLIDGGRPRYWRPYVDDLPHAERVQQVVDWLRLPTRDRPALVTVYFSDVDTAGHTFGPDSAEVRDAALGVDRSIGTLVAAINELRLPAGVTYVVVSDHGMAAISLDRLIVLDDYLDPATVEIIDSGPVLGLRPRDGNVERAYAALRDRHPHLAVYRNADIPAVYGLAGHPRVPPVVGIADEGWSVATRQDIARWTAPGGRAPGGNHGYASATRSMHGLFVASGPNIARGRIVPAFDSVHVYELLAALLGVQPAPNDGEAAVTREFLR
jgi:predicted AlkP superfamily pyrophosphatase or phosphodiesterase